MNFNSVTPRIPERMQERENIILSIGGKMVFGVSQNLLANTSDWIVEQWQTMQMGERLLIEIDFIGLVHRSEGENYQVESTQTYVLEEDGELGEMVDWHFEHGMIHGIDI